MELLLKLYEVEPQPAVWPSESKRAEFLGMGIHPVALDTKFTRKGCGINIATGVSVIVLSQEFNDSLGDLLDCRGAQSQRLIHLRCRS